MGALVLTFSSTLTLQTLTNKVIPFELELTYSSTSTLLREPLRALHRVATPTSTHTNIGLYILPSSPQGRYSHFSRLMEGGSQDQGRGSGGIAGQCRYMCTAVLCCTGCRSGERFVLPWRTGEEAWGENHTKALIQCYNVLRFPTAIPSHRTSTLPHTPTHPLPHSPTLPPLKGSTGGTLPASRRSVPWWHSRSAATGQTRTRKAS